MRGLREYVVPPGVCVGVVTPVGRASAASSPSRGRLPRDVRLARLGGAGTGAGTGKVSDPLPGFPPEFWVCARIS
jgi:hypothetical protein